MKREVLMMKGNGVRGVCDFSLRRFQALNVL